jgi:hypothetical protein
MSTDQPFRNDADMKTKLEVLRNDKSTFFDRARAEAGQELGRYSHLGKEQAVTGSRPVQQWPTIPSGPWSEPDPSGQEPPLNVDISKVDQS